MATSARLYGRAYGDALQMAVAAAGRGTVICTMPFDTAEDAAATALAFTRLESVLSRHLRFVVGPPQAVTKDTSEAAAMELAAAMEAVAKRYSWVRSAAAHPAGRGWDTAADALATGHDILASHLDADRNPLTSEGELILHPVTRWHVVARLADLTLTLESQRRGLLRQLGAASAMPSRSALAALHHVRLDHPGAAQAAARVLDAAQAQPSLPLLERIDPAPPARVADLPDDPLDRAVVLVNSLARYAYDLMREGRGLGSDGMCSYAALGVDIAGHTAVVLEAVHARAVALLGDHTGTLAQPGLTRAITAVQMLGRRWRSVYRHWAHVNTLQVTPRLVHHRVRLTCEALASATRDGYLDKSARELLPDAGSVSRCIDATARLVAPLGPLAQHQLATAQHMHVTADLLTPISPATGWLGGKPRPEARQSEHVRLPYWAFRQVCDAYEEAAQASARAMNHLDPLHRAIVVSPGSRIDAKAFNASGPGPTPEPPTLTGSPTPPPTRFDLGL